MNAPRTCIFTPTSTATDCYSQFRKTFDWNGSPALKLTIAAETTFVAFVNGKRLPIAQLADMPLERTCSELDITPYLKNGQNVIAVEVHALGDKFLTCQPATPFLWCQVTTGNQTFLETDTTWKCRLSSQYHNGLNCKVTGQLGFAFEFDAHFRDGWHTLPYADSSWDTPVCVELPGATFVPRAVPQLQELPMPTTAILQMGYLLRKSQAETFAEQAYQDFLAPVREKQFFEELPPDTIKEGYTRKNLTLSHTHGNLLMKPLPQDVDGAYLIVDLGQETVGFLRIELDAPDGTIVDICHGEHLDDGRVRSHIATRHFTDRYICREGSNNFTYAHRRLGCRYLELHFTSVGSGRIRLGYIGMIPLELPLPEPAAFKSADRLLARINAVSIRTLNLCMHEHYEDCPWREQSLYAYDSRNQILYGYYVWGNYDFAAASLNLLGKNYDGERYLYLTSPGGPGFPQIPVFTLVWISEIYEHWMYSGSPALFNTWQHQIDEILDKALQHPDPEFNGLYSPDDSYWNFCEWNGAMSQLSGNGQGPYNIYLAESLRNAAKMHEMAGNAERARTLFKTAQTIADTIEKLLWEPNRKFYSFAATDAAKQSDIYGHIQAIMLASGTVPEDKCPALLDHFANKTALPYDLSALQYVINGLMNNGPEARKILVNELRDILEPIILSGGTSIWETRQGAPDFDGAASLCHAWSSAMPYFCGRAILGVRPLEPGFKTFAVQPYTAELPEAEGQIPTPAGFISVKWKNHTDGLHLEITHPKATQPVVSALPECPIAQINTKAY